MTKQRFEVSRRPVKPRRRPAHNYPQFKHRKKKYIIQTLGWSPDMTSPDATVGIQRLDKPNKYMRITVAELVRDYKPHKYQCIPYKALRRVHVPTR